MTDVLDKIDASLEEVEEQLLTEFHRIRDASPNPNRDVEVDPGVRNALSEITDYLHTELENSGAGTLSLVTQRHEVLYSRIAVLRHLLHTQVRVSHLMEANEGVAIRRKQLEGRVLAERQKQDPSATRQSEARKSGLSNSPQGMFNHRPTDQQVNRNVLGVTSREEDRLEHSQLYLDNGIFSASRELSMLASLTRGGTLDRPPEESDSSDTPQPTGKAVFEARDLRYHAPPTESVQRRRQPEPEAEPEPEPQPEISKRDIAQTPDEIRRKLEARRGSATGKASFEAKDLSSSTYNDPPRPRQQPGRQADPEPPRSGKASFVSRDINPVAPQDPPRRREQDQRREDDDKKDEDKRKGPAVFESRELSNNPFPKKD